MGNVHIVQKAFVTRPTVNLQKALLILTNQCNAFMSEMDQRGLGLFEVEYRVQYLM